MKLWETKSSQKLHPTIEKFTIGEDLRMDEYLIGYACLESVAHSYMLSTFGYITKSEFQKVKKALKEIREKALKKNFKLKDVEDGQSAIEATLTKKFGDLGGKIHLGRSRNDQSATVINLFAKNELTEIKKELLYTIEILQKLAQKWKLQAMPGYTHTRPAMVSTLGHYFAAFAEALSLDFLGLESAYEVVNRCPLGSAAGYGTAVPINQNLTAKLLGFEEKQINSLAAQLGRGQTEVTTLGALSNVMLTLSRIANDLIYFSTSEFDFISLKDSVATGSSIMPQKKNPDPLELIRGASGILLGAHTQAATILKGLPAGYQRDLQLIKQPFVQGVKLAKHSLQAFQVVLSNLVVNKDQLEKSASDTHLYAADIANELVLEKGLSFREAYRKVKEGYMHAGWKGVIYFEDTPSFNPQKSIQAKKCEGMPGNLKLEVGNKWIARQKSKVKKDANKFEKAIEKIWKL